MSEIEQNAFFKLSYGLFVLTANDKNFDNGCIINTVTQVTDTPKCITIAVNKANFTTQMILNTNKFNISVISEKANFELFKHFGFCSGKDTNKFENYPQAKRSGNGLLYCTDGVNAFMSAKVISTTDLGTHVLFLAEIEEAKVLTNDNSATYDYYFKNIKPKPQATPAKAKKQWVCKICGYVYEGDELPSDFICPLCKHGAEDFEPLN